MLQKTLDNISIHLDEPRIGRSEIAYKWKCRIVLAFMKTPCKLNKCFNCRAIHKDGLRRNNTPAVYDELYLLNWFIFSLLLMYG
mmetsp:Transcript_14234/g.16303  ORF Transcript_14234/g.16303 Transcript_14234/m.16303 type:complete len:84 (-) Transcript_14234:32-283(-)